MKVVLLASAGTTPRSRLRLRLDPAGRLRARDLRARATGCPRGAACAPARLVEPDVQPEHGHVDGDDAGEQRADDDDPDDPARDARVALGRAAARGRGRAAARRRDRDATGARPPPLLHLLRDPEPS